MWQKFLINFFSTGRLVPSLAKMRRASSCSRRKQIQGLTARYYVQWDLGTLTQTTLFIQSTMFKGSGDFSEEDTEPKSRVNTDTKKTLPSKSP